MKPIISVLQKAIKISAVFVVLGTVCFFIMAMKAQKMAETVWEQLGIGVPQANMDIKNSFLHGYLDYTGAKNAKNIALGNRVAVVNQLIEYAKKHYKSDEFRSAYAKYRD